MEGENSLDADPVRNLANRKRRAIAAAVDFDHHALERLHALLLTFANLHVDAHAIAHTKLGEVASKTSVLDLLDDAIHGKMPSVEQDNLSEPLARLNPASTGRASDRG